jgi:hypothetical protein
MLTHRTELRDLRVFNLVPFDEVTVFARQKEKGSSDVQTLHSRASFILNFSTWCVCNEIVHRHSIVR